MSDVPTPTAAPVMEVPISLYESQPKIYPRSVTGRYARIRWLMVWLTQLVFYGMPWLTWHGRQAILFDLAERRFYILGLVLHPQDFIYLAALLVLSAVSLFFFTALAGRLWCGYACPQTVYTEIFLWIERKVEGDRQARMRLDAQPWSVPKLARKGGKHALWLAVALFTGFSFVGYFTPVRTLAAECLTGALSGWEGFWVLFYGLATYGNAGYMREQICKYMCPYARFQSALIDMDSLVIAYDERRGEPRGARPRKTDPQSMGLGSCIDCTLCVQVCPTGIDIRQGLQNECIGCAACIDVCDTVMDKMGYAKGLIRYSSGRAMQQDLSAKDIARRVVRPRVLVYGLLLLGVGLAFVWSLSHRHSFAVNIIRDRGALARMVGRGDVENVYRLQVMNRSEQRAHYRVSVAEPAGLVIDEGQDIEVSPTDIGTLPVRLRWPAPYVAQAPAVVHVELKIEATDDAHTARESIKERTTFLLPKN